MHEDAQKLLRDRIKRFSLREQADHYNKDFYRFQFKTVGERKKALKLPELRGFEVWRNHRRLY